jgi:hypothetical protein
MNITLYRRLTGTFGKVVVKNAGMAAKRDTVYDPVTGNYRDRRVRAGEEYAVCCPLCSDTRFRLLLSHQYGVSRGSNNNSHLVHCFNAGCSLNAKDPKAIKKLYDMLTGTKLYDLSKARIGPATVAASTEPPTWPGDVLRVDQLDRQHECRRYLERDRLFDVTTLARSYNVHYCTSSEHRVCCDKIIIPVYASAKLVGWQARCCFDAADWSKVYTPKYYTCPQMKKSLYLYNLDVAKNCKLGIGVEGVTDVWRIGAPGVCGFGAFFQSQQIELIVKNFKHKPFVWVMDGDIWDEKSKVDKSTRSNVQATIQVLKRRMSQFCVIRLPADKDPGGYTSRSYLRGYITHHAKAQGVELLW